MNVARQKALADESRLKRSNTMKNLISKTIALTVVIFIGTSLIVANTNAVQTIPQTQTNHKKHHQTKNVSAKVQNQAEMKNMPMKMKMKNTAVKKKRMGMKKKSLKKKSNMKNMKMKKQNTAAKKKRMEMKKKSLKKKSNMKNMKMNKDKMKMEDKDM